MKNYKTEHLRCRINLVDLYDMIFEIYPDITKKEIEQAFGEAKNDFIKWLENVNKDYLKYGEEKPFFNI